MSDWKPDLYLKFETQRTQPALDLVARIGIAHPKRIVDVGCGPGNSTAVLKNRWTNAAITGLDSSPAMIAQAREAYSGISWVCADAAGDLSALGAFNIVFSNAAIQWIPDQKTLLKNLFGLLESGGELAVQVPNTKNMGVQAALDSLVSSDKWRSRLAQSEAAHSVHQAAYYYDILSGFTADIDLWETDYYHIMNSHADIVQWYSSTGLRPYLNALTEEEQTDFLADFETALKTAYAVQPNGSVLFAFTRIFFIARKA